jgi:hypothetical protein
MAPSAWHVFGLVGRWGLQGWLVMVFLCWTTHESCHLLHLHITDMCGQHMRVGKHVALYAHKACGGEHVAHAPPKGMRQTAHSAPAQQPLLLLAGPGSVALLAGVQPVAGRCARPPQDRECRHTAP